MIRELSIKPVTDPVYINSTWISIKDNLDLEVERIIQYYRVANGYVNNNTFLSRLINTVDVKPDTNDTNADIYKILTFKVRGLESVFGITGRYGYGTVSNDGMNKNLNIYTSKQVDYTITDDITLLDIPALGVLDHDNTDVSMIHPMKYTGKPTVVIYYIDVVLLLLQYRTWLKTRTYGESTNTEHFIYNIVLPNTIRSYCNISIRNMCATGASITKGSKDSSISLSDYDDRLDKITTQIYTYFTKRRLSIYSMLDMIPCIGTDRTYLRYIQSYYTGVYNGYNKGVEYYFDIHILTLMLSNSTPKNINFNKTILRRYERLVKRLIGSGSYTNMIGTVKGKLELDNLFILEGL